MGGGTKHEDTALWERYVSENLDSKFEKFTERSIFQPCNMNTLTIVGT
jgi:hypothetical protein